MEKYIAVAEATTKFLEALAVVSLLTYGIICFERWQRPADLKKSIESVDTNKASV